MTQPSRVNLLDGLLTEGYRFEFFQAVRVLERVARLRRAQGEPPTGNGATEPLGCDAHPSREALHVRAAAGLGFAAAAIQAVKASVANNSAPPQVFVNFMGLTGPSGTLPHHYSSLLLERLREKDKSFAEFLDLFNHRLISLFYRAWEKYRFPTAYERARLDAGDTPMAAWADADPFTSMLLSLIGLGTRGLRDRLAVSDEALLRYAGHLSHQPRSAVSVELTLADYFRVPVQVRQFQGRWLPLELEGRSRLPAPRDRDAAYCQLGRTVVLGERIWDVQSRFRIRLGPLTYVQYCQFLPGGGGLRRVHDLTRILVGSEFEFDIQPVLLAAEVPSCRLTRGATGGRIGHNVWLMSGPAAQDFEGAAFTPHAA